MVSLKNFLRHLIGSTASAISAPIALPVKSNPVIHASRSSVDADSPVSIHTPFFKQLILQKSTRSTASTDESPIYSPVVVNQTSGTSRAVTSAESLDLVQSHLFLQPDRFQISLGCSTDHSTAALMVIAHKVGCYTGKASLCAWNSSIPDDFSSVLVDLMPDLAMNSYSLFSGLIELIVPPEVILLYGSLPRPPESCFISYSWLRFTDANLWLVK
ncbi:uncharacterized protein LOC130499697 [Raphanus sativus]|uniref:Uncharacterized protein LOC130499697 n=1 Tax=Raphanus sativus TaxID=3726 RepID=A0A9W3CED8_RAPSA|nr:uncharacterized protein LOC130499697 [Raphanus sativus]